VPGPDLPLRALLSADGPYHTVALPLALGDSWLCNNAPIYTSIRYAAKSEGFSFNCDSSPLLQRYDAFPIGCLMEILASRHIPYFDNRSPMVKLANEGSILTIDATFLANNLKKNVTMHEACHCIATVVLDNAPACLITRALAAEAFANTVEILASMDCQSPAGQIFFALNSYHTVQPRLTRLLQVARAHFTASGLFDILFFGYYLANARTRRSRWLEIIAASEFITGAEGDSMSVLVAADLMAHCDALSLAFRTAAARFHFATMGLLREYELSTQSSLADVEESLASLGQSYTTLKAVTGIGSARSLPPNQENAAEAANHVLL
jgi:hypothetical protein